MNQSELNQLQQEVSEHLWKGRYRMALPLAKKLFDGRNDNSEAAISYAWALLENGDPNNAAKLMQLSKQLANDTLTSKMYRGYLKMRLSNFESAIYDFNMTEGKQKELLAWTYLNKAKSLASIGETAKALNVYDLAIMIDNNANPEWKKIRKFLVTLLKVKKNVDPISDDSVENLINLSRESLNIKEYWFALNISKLLIENNLVLNSHPELELIELEAMLRLNQLEPAKEKIELLKENFVDDDKFNALVKALNRIETLDTIDFEANNAPTTEVLKETKVFFPNKSAEVFEVGIFDGDKDVDNPTYYSAISLSEITNIGMRFIFNNPFFKKEDKIHNIFIAWYLDDDLVDQSTIKLNVPKNWDAMVVKEFSNTKNNHLWQNGNVNLEVFINREKVLTKTFQVGNQTIKEETINSNKALSIEYESLALNSVLEELDQIIGLENVKNTVRGVVDYLEFMHERKSQGLEADGGIVINAAFLGNPGTGKTTVARLMGKIYKALGLLPEGKVIEVDRAALVGQYVGETAQKTDKIIEEAIGNVLFIDEAYTLTPPGKENDFGKEAIEILLKRMEDKKGQFFVIVAGYPNEMKNFFSSNPGLKSRFTHYFDFEDYQPNELFKIFTQFTKQGEYRLNADVEKMLNKAFINLYRNRDENFGNAREVRRIFEEAKMSLSKRYLQIPKHEKTKDKLVTITIEDISKTLAPAQRKSEVIIPINEEMLSDALMELDKLTGLSSVQTEVREMVKLARYYHNTNERLSDKFNSHIVFLGNPGTGKTTIARIIVKIYSALGILSKGHLIETDRQGLVASFIGGTADKTKEIIDKSMGGVLFIDEAYALVKEGNSSDFGQEAIDTLLKRMEDNRGKFIVIAAGYTNEMNSFLDSNPGMKSRFNKIFHFEDYTPNELLEIFRKISKSNNLELESDAKKLLFKHFQKIYRERDKHFGNARIVRNLFDSINKQRELKLSEKIGNVDSIKINASDVLSVTKITETQKDVAIVGDNEKLNEYLTELNKLSGLDSIKENVTNLVNSLKIAKERKDRGMKVIRKPLHSVFIGNPGTGKTTIARLLSNIFKELGVLSKGHLVEVDRAQLVAGYSGQTAIKTNEVIQKAMGGTLFIDEAYTLSRGRGDFGQEAIDTLLKQMEDNADKFVVIVAGYTNEMHQFLESNPGLTSRFTQKFNFEDYNPSQLVTIAESMAKSNGYNFTTDSLVALKNKFTTLYEKRDKNFGNARTARNLFLEVISTQEKRLASLIDYNDEDLATLTIVDIPE